MHHRSLLPHGARHGRANQTGVTLIELMIVVCIVAILAAVAIPNYRAYVLRSNRTDATSALMRVAAAQEKFYLQRNTYTTDATALLGRNTSERGWYTITIVPGAAGITTSYTATAAPVAGQVQASDTTCTSFTLTQSGVRGPSSSATECWR
jgi:type IV pilus assembly protein PilE